MERAAAWDCKEFRGTLGEGGLCQDHWGPARRVHGSLLAHTNTVTRKLCQYGLNGLWHRDELPQPAVPRVPFSTCPKAPNTKLLRREQQKKKSLPWTENNVPTDAALNPRNNYEHALCAKISLSLWRSPCSPTDWTSLPNIVKTRTLLTQT